MSEKEKNVRVVACPQPFSTIRTERNVAAGKTLAEIVKDLGIRLETATDARVLIGDAEVPRVWWQNVKPKSGVTVTIRAVPRGGNGKSFLRVIIGIAGAFVGAFTGGAGAAAIWGTAAGATGAAIGQAAGGLVGFVVLGGSK